MSGPFPLTFQRTFERVEGGTRFTIRYDAEVRGFFKLVMPLLVGSVKRQHEGDLRKVKELIPPGSFRLLESEFQPDPACTKRNPVWFADHFPNQLINQVRRTVGGFAVDPLAAS